MNLNPEKTGITIYTKTNCINCDKIKGYMQNNHYEYKTIYCDEYLKDEETKKEFLKQMFYLSGVKVKQFPIVFIDGRYIGGYYDCLEYFEDF